MESQNRSKTILCAGLLCALIGLVCGGSAGGAHLHTYRVTIQNLTQGQALSPPIVAIHTDGVHFFTMGAPASVELQAIAELGDNSLLHAALMGDSRVDAIAVSAHPLVPTSDPGGTGLSDATRLQITTDSNAPFISIATMLVCTNDGFTGLDSVALPTKGAKLLLTSGYDAGTEINTQDANDLAPGCQALIGVASTAAGSDVSDPMLAENGVVTYHPGIQDFNDLNVPVHGWTNPVAKITIAYTDDDANDFVARLSGAGEVPPVCTYATGWATFTLREEAQELDYELHVKNISGITQAHIHRGSPAENGGVEAFLFGPVDAMGLLDEKALLASGTITPADLVGNFAGDFVGFVDTLRHGSLYVNVHTADDPGGHIRGQIGSVPLTLAE